MKPFPTPSRSGSRPADGPGADDYTFSPFLGSLPSTAWSETAAGLNHEHGLIVRNIITWRLPDGSYGPSKCSEDPPEVGRWQTPSGEVFTEGVVTLFTRAARGVISLVEQQGKVVLGITGRQ